MASKISVGLYHPLFCKTPLSPYTLRKKAGHLQVAAETNVSVLDPQDATPFAGKAEKANALSESLKSKSWIEDQLESEQLDSTFEHRVWVGAASILLFGLFFRGVEESGNAGIGILAVAGGYATIDLLSGIYHWGIDNYGSPSTPFVGKQIEGFQGHHLRPWTITHRQFCNNVHPICKPAIPITLLMLAIHPPFFVDIYMSIGTAGAILAQQFHSWAHTKKSQLPAAVKLLQDMGVLVSTVEHCRHHQQPFNSNYCIVGGFWNRFLDTSGLFEAWESIIYDKTGVKPRCWNEGGAPDVSYYDD